MPAGATTVVVKYCQMKVSLKNDVYDMIIHRTLLQKFRIRNLRGLGNLLSAYPKLLLQDLIS